MRVSGALSSSGKTISQTPAVSVAAYEANDAVGGLLEFAFAAEHGKGGVIKDVIIIDDAGQDSVMELWLFSATFTAIADEAAFDISQTDSRKLVAIISTSNGAWYATGTESVAVIEASQRYDLEGTSLFGQMVTRGTPTFSAVDDVTVIIGLLPD